MPKVVAARNRYRAGRGRAGPDCLSSGLVRSAAMIAATSFSLPPMGASLAGTLSGQPQWFQGMGRISTSSCRNDHDPRRPSVSGLHLTGQQGREPQVRSSLPKESRSGTRFMRDYREFSSGALFRFPFAADNECLETPILRRLRERTRGMNTCR